MKIIDIDINNIELEEVKGLSFRSLNDMPEKMSKRNKQIVIDLANKK